MQLRRWRLTRKFASRPNVDNRQHLNMAGKFDRNIELTRRFISGESARDLAVEYGIGAPRVRAIADEHRPLIIAQQNRPVPAGLSLRTAVAIEDATGIWPTVEEAMELWDRQLDILRAPGVRRRDYLDLKSWLASLGLTEDNNGA